MLTWKQKQAVNLLASGALTQKEAAGRVGVSANTMYWWNKQPEFRRAIETTRKGRRTETERLGEDCMALVMREISRRLTPTGITRMEVRKLLEVMERLGRVLKVSTRETLQREPETQEQTRIEEGTIDADTRKRMYSQRVRELDDSETDRPHG